MTETATKLPAGKEEKADRPAEWRPFESLRREVDRLFEDFQLGSWRSPFGRSLFDVQPFWRGEVGWGKAPAVDIVEKEKATRSQRSCRGWTRAISTSSSPTAR
jgi:HSP20 family protein